MSKTITIETIESERDNERALARLDKLMDSDKPEDKAEVNLLSFCIGEYEKQAYPIEAPDSVDMIKFRMSNRGLDLEEVESKIGFSLAAIFNDPEKLEDLTLGQVKTISQTVGIPLACIVQ